MGEEEAIEKRNKRANTSVCVRKLTTAKVKIKVLLVQEMR